jgi:hypothetical protein
MEEKVRTGAKCNEWRKDRQIGHADWWKHKAKILPREQHPTLIISYPHTLTPTLSMMSLGEYATLLIPPGTFSHPSAVHFPTLSICTDCFPLFVLLRTRFLTLALAPPIRIRLHEGQETRQDAFF